MDRSQFIEWVVEKVGGEMSGKKRWALTKHLAELLGQDKVEVFRSVEAKTKAKDKGVLLEIVDATR